MKRFKRKLDIRIPKPLNLSRDGMKTEVLTIGLFVFIIITTFWLIDMVFGLMSEEMKFTEVKSALLLIRDYLVWFALGAFYILSAKKKKFNYESVVAFTAFGSIYTAVKLYMADLGAVWVFAVEWLVITVAIYNMVKISFSHFAKPLTE